MVRDGRAGAVGARPPSRCCGGGWPAPGVPVEVASDETPLVREPAVRPLLDALRAVVNLDNDDPDDADYLDPVAAEGLLVSPMVGLDATDVRTPVRGPCASGTSSSPWRRTARRGPRRTSCARRCSERRAPGRRGLRRPGGASGWPRSARPPAHRARRCSTPRGTVEEVLWTLWSGTSWPEHLRARTRRGGSTARLANRDLDAMCALFETAARAEEQVGHKSVGEFLATLEAAGDPRRHPGGAWHPRRVGAPADGPPVQGPGVAPGRGRARAGDGAGPTCADARACSRPTASAPSGTPSR